MLLLATRNSEVHSANIKQETAVVTFSVTRAHCADVARVSRPLDILL